MRRPRLMRSGLVRRPLLFYLFCHSVDAFGNRSRQKNGRLIKNISPAAQAELAKNFNSLLTGPYA
jgi:hypothetical protein